MERKGKSFKPNCPKQIFNSLENLHLSAISLSRSQLMQMACAGFMRRKELGEGNGLQASNLGAVSSLGRLAEEGYSDFPGWNLKVIYPILVKVLTNGLTCLEEVK